MAYSYFLKKFFAIQVEFVYFMWQKEYFRKRKKPIQQMLNRLSLSKTAATYSPTVTQYHRRDEA